MTEGEKMNTKPTRETLETKEAANGGTLGRKSERNGVWGRFSR